MESKTSQVSTGLMAVTAGIVIGTAASWALLFGALDRALGRDQPRPRCVEGRCVMQLPIKAKLRLQAMIDGEQMTRDTLSSITRRLSELNHAMQTAPRSEIANMEHEVVRQREKLDTAQRKYKAAADLNAQIKHWLSCLPANASLEDSKLKSSWHPMKHSAL